MASPPPCVFDGPINGEGFRAYSIRPVVAALRAS